MINCKKIYQKKNYIIYQSRTLTMGNYCHEKTEYAQENTLRKVSIASNSTTVSKFNSIDSMRKQSSKLLKFLQTQSSSSLGLSSTQIEQIHVVSQLGKGGQSKVFQIHLKGTRRKSSDDLSDQPEKIAVKRTNLKKQRNNLGSLLLAKKLMIQNECPFLITGLFTFSCEKYFYSGMQVAEGGDLTSFLQRWRGKGDAFRNLGQAGVRMVLAGIVIGLQYLHQRNLIYCDLKIDNVLIDKKGFPMLADFQLVSDQDKIPRNQIRGTITALGPEIYFEDDIDKGIDLWALGILSPYQQSDIVDPLFPEICQKMENSYHQGKKQISDELANLLNSLLKYNPKERIGYKGIKEIKDHKFFQDFDWERYYKKEMDNPLEDIVKRFPIKSMIRRKTGFPEVINEQTKYPKFIRPRKYTN